MDKVVEIAGAGPASLVAAINLVNAGWRVTVYEEKPDVGQRFHGDFQGIENWSSPEDATSFLKRIGIGEDFAFRSYNRIVAFDANLERTVLQSERPFFYLVERGTNRGSLDRWLIEAARESGVEVLFNKRVERLEKRGIVGTGPKAADAIARGIIFNTEMEDIAAAILDDRLAPKGYAYLLIHNGKGTMATCMFREFQREKECFERTLEAFRRVFPSLDIAGEKEFGGYGNFFFGKPVFENNRYYIGEAAGLQDCLWGFGMRYAMASGYLVATSIIEGRDYAALLKKELLPMQKTALVNRFFYERLGNEGYAYVIKRLAEADPVSEVGRQYRPSFLKSLLYPFAAMKYKSRVVDKGCHSEGCTCVWCRCGKGNPGMQI